MPLTEDQIRWQRMQLRADGASTRQGTHAGHAEDTTRRHREQHEIAGELLAEALDPSKRAKDLERAEVEGVFCCFPVGDGKRCGKRLPAAFVGYELCSDHDPERELTPAEEADLAKRETKRLKREAQATAYHGRAVADVPRVWPDGGELLRREYAARAALEEEEAFSVGEGPALTSKQRQR